MGTEFPGLHPRTEQAYKVIPAAYHAVLDKIVDRKGEVMRRVRPAADGYHVHFRTVGTTEHKTVKISTKSGALTEALNSVKRQLGGQTKDPKVAKRSAQKKKTAAAPSSSLQ